MSSRKRRKLNGDNLRYRRDLKLWRQDDVVEASGLTKSTVSRLEQSGYHTVHFATVKKLCAALECEPDDLLEWVSDESGSLNTSSAIPLVSLLFL